METGHTKNDVVRLGIVAGTVAIRDHGAIAAKHLDSRRNLHADITLLPCV